MRQSTNRRWQPARSERPLPLFDFLPARFTGIPISPPANRSRTSQAAARSVAHATLSIRERILEHLAQCGPHGATATEICQSLNLLLQTVSARLNELEQLRLIIDSGQTRLTPSGRPSRVVQFRNSPPGPPGSSTAAGQTRSSPEHTQRTPPGESRGGSP